MYLTVFLETGLLLWRMYEDKRIQVLYNMISIAKLFQYKDQVYMWEIVNKQYKYITIKFYTPYW